MALPVGIHRDVCATVAIPTKWGTMDFRILGPLEVLDESGRSLPLGGAKQRALLAVLLINANEVVSADRLIDSIWGEGPPPTAANALQVYVSQLRKVLRVAGFGAGDGEPTDPIVTRVPGYALQVTDDDLDLARFKDLTQRGREALMADDPAGASVFLHSALALWRGQALADFTYEPFAQIQIEKLDEMRLLALEDRIEADLALGRHAEAIPELEAVVATDPHRERLREHLMLALYRSGRQADALAVYRDVSSLLSDQLGLDPSPGLQRLHEAILRQDSSLVESEAERPTELVKASEAAFEPDLPMPEPTIESPSYATRDEVLPVTVLFADIVGSTSLAERLSPEEVRAIVGECVSRMSHVVEELDGTIQAYMGDGICAYFGLPLAHEDDVERAARAALRIRRVAEEFAREVESAWGISGFAVRIGVNTGRTVVGMVGAAAPQVVAFGDATNIASRLESGASPGTIVVGEAVAARLTRGFALKPLGSRKVRGRKEAVEAWELLGAASTPEAVPPTPLVGREREMEAGAGSVADLEAGRGQVLLIQGDPGIGKSRLVAEIRALTGDRVSWLEGRCRSYGGDLPAWPFVEALRGWLGASAEEPPVVVRMKLRAKLEDLMGSEGADVLPFLGHLLSLDVDPAQEQLIGSVSAAELAERTRDACAEWMRRLASRGPLVLVVEDVHDADAATRELAESLLPITDEAALMMILTARATPGSDGWRLYQLVRSEYRHRSADLQLEPLSDEAAGFLVDAVAPTGSLDAPTKADVVARAAGNPLYIEELLRSLVESGGLDRRQSWTLSASSAMLLPAALESLLVARIQHLVPLVRGLAQVASVIGQEILAALMDDVVGAVEVRAGIGILLRAEILVERRRYPELEYAFRHPLLREAALSTLTPARARELYGRVAAALEGRTTENQGERLERLAYYYYRSDNKEKAIEYLELAARQAIDLDAIQNATELLQRAEKAASALDDKETQRRLGKLLVTLSQSPS
jgi:class 3 adenylate cyclase/DNA-binding SARP family transcriptional activator